MMSQNIRSSVVQPVIEGLKSLLGRLTRAVVTRGVRDKTSACWRRYDIPTYQRRGIQLTVRANY